MAEKTVHDWIRERAESTGHDQEAQLELLELGYAFHKGIYPAPRLKELGIRVGGIFDHRGRADITASTGDPEGPIR